MNLFKAFSYCFSDQAQFWKSDLLRTLFPVDREEQEEVGDINWVEDDAFLITITPIH